VLRVLCVCRYYRAVFEKNLEFLQGKSDRKTKHNLINVAMELRKVCNVSATQVHMRWVGARPVPR